MKYPKMHRLHLALNKAVYSRMSRLTSTHTSFRSKAPSSNCAQRPSPRCSYWHPENEGEHVARPSTPRNRRETQARHCGPSPNTFAELCVSRRRKNIRKQRRPLTRFGGAGARRRSRRPLTLNQSLRADQFSVARLTVIYRC